MKKIIWPILFVLLTLSVFAYPPISTELYGRAFSSNFNVSVGVTIEVFDGNNASCGTFTTVTQGGYGLLSCRGDDPETSIDEGAVAGDLLSFRMGGQAAASWENITWTSGEFFEVNISIPLPVCGDSLCDIRFEDIVTCVEDCNFTGNQTGNGTNNGTGSGGEGGSGGSGGTGSGGGGGGGSGGSGGGGGSGGAAFSALSPPCEEFWKCGDWGVCTINETRERGCEDLNRCGTTDNQPRLQEECVYLPTCFDGTLNGFETDLDCGGPCDGCLVGQKCLVHDDCKTNYCIDGICRVPSCDDPSIFCRDKLRNCGEEKVDCGGPCNACPLVERPRLFPKLVCEKAESPFNLEFFIFFAIIFAVIIFKLYRSKLNIEEIIKNKEELKEIEVIRKKFSEKRKFWLFTATLLSLALIVYLYYYYFFLCETELRYIWWLIALVFVLPIIIHYGIKIYEYNEEEKIKKLKALSDAHYKQVMRLIEIENENIEEIEKELANKLLKLLQDAKFRKVVDEFPDLKKIYKEIVELYHAYLDHTNPYDVERELCQQVYALETNPHFQDLASKHPEIKGIYSRLRILYKQYIQKQELYDELDKIESGWELSPEEEAKLLEEAKSKSAKEEADDEDGVSEKSPDDEE